ncbi:ANTAR domain-containing protein [Streptomyces sp. PA5.6]|uniref:ANTAR domain-containing protein n=1 Tax=Streptomyces sp. PA5.6 TaxID=3035651 RepID=UPI003904A983
MTSIPTASPSPEERPSSREDRLPSPERAASPERISSPEGTPSPEPSPERVSSLERVPSPEQVSALEQAPSPEQVSALERVPSPEQVPLPEQASALEQVPPPGRASSPELIPSPGQVPSPGRAPSAEGASERLVLLEREAEQLRVTAGRLREQVAELEVRARARPRIALAEGILVERYRLAHAQDAFMLLRRASQHANIKLHQLAAAVVRTPGPAPGAERWLPERTRHAALPGLDALRAGTLDARNQGEVLGAALHRVLTVTGTGMGNVQLLEDDVLRMAKHAGLPRHFTDHFAFVDGRTSCSRAAEASSQVTVKEVASSAGFGEEDRRVILTSGSRACHSIPLVDEHQVVHGVISSHHDRPLTGFTQAQLRELHTTGRTMGEWIRWHQETVLLDALEDLHRLALAGQD